ncbi:MAG TPA: BlaI/MecI/CopY family transcriptional regulator [Candidatus Obscuribacterales bacterium]
MRLQDDNASFRINQEGLRKFLGDLECEIMELVWKKADPTVTVREIFDSLRQERQIAYTTVMTTMVRLAEKGLLKIVDKAGLANCYAPVDDRQSFINKTVAMVLEIFLRDFPQESQNFLDGKAREGKKVRR